MTFPTFHQLTSYDEQLTTVTSNRTFMTDTTLRTYESFLDEVARERGYAKEMWQNKICTEAAQRWGDHRFNEGMKAGGNSGYLRGQSEMKDRIYDACLNNDATPYLKLIQSIQIKL